MMEGKIVDGTRRVIVLKNLNSNMVEEAIIILKKDQTPNRADIISTAEKIIDDYISKNGKSRNSKRATFKKRVRELFIPVAVAVITTLLTICIYLIIPK